MQTKGDSFDLRQRLLFFVHDLLHYREEDPIIPNPDHRVLFLSDAHFTPDQMREIATFRLPSGVTFRDHVCGSIADKIAANANVCSSHDIAPLYMSAFDISPGFHRDPKFKKSHRKFVRTRTKLAANPP